MISRDEAMRYSRLVGPEETLFAMRMAPMAGNVPVDIASVEELEAFLEVITPEEIAQLNMKQRINYVDFKTAALWIREIIGDAVLADSLNELIALDRVFGLLVPDVKKVLAERLEQYREAVGDFEPNSQ